MPTKLRRGRWAALIVLVALLAGGSWWGVAHSSKGADPLASGQSAYDRGDWVGAAGLAREVLKGSPTDSRAIRLLARASARSGRDEAALAPFRRLESSVPEAEDHFLLARIFGRRGQADQARAQLWRAYRQDPACGEAVNDLIRSLAQDDALTKAVELATELRERPGWQARARSLWACSARRKAIPPPRPRPWRRRWRSSRTSRGPPHRRRWCASCWPATGSPSASPRRPARRSARSTTPRSAGSGLVPTCKRADRARNGRTR